MIVVGIDPGPNESGVAKILIGERIVSAANVPNKDVFKHWLWLGAGSVVVLEKTQSYGKSFRIGGPLIETIEWSGRFIEQFGQSAVGPELQRMARPEVKGHLLRTAAGNDAKVRAALIARFGGPKSAKKDGLLDGFDSHMWPALALAVVAAEKRGLVAWPEWRSGWRRA